MNILTVLDFLKEKKLIADTEESISLFSDCFNKFGISILLLKDEEKFRQIVDLLVENNIPIQKANGMYCLRLFAVNYYDFKTILDEYSEINEIPFLRKYPEIITEAQTVHVIAQNMKTYQELNIPYKNGENYDIDKILNANFEQKSDQQNDYALLKSYLEDETILDKLENPDFVISNENFNSALELQKVENKICESYLVSNGETWDISINGININRYEEVKNTLKALADLNLDISYNDAMLVALFYKSSISENDMKEAIDFIFRKEENA